MYYLIPKVYFSLINTGIFRPIRERREILEEKMKEIKNHVMFSEMKKINKKEDLRDMINRVLKQGLEGLVLKDMNVRYLSVYRNI